MPAALVLTDEGLEDLDAFATALTSVGLKAWRSTLSAARTFQGRVERAGGWELVELDTQLEWMRKARPFVSWLLITGRLTASADFLAFADLRLGGTARRHLPDVHEWFVAATGRVDATNEDTALQWNALCKIAALSGTRPDKVTTETFFAARSAIYDAYRGGAAPKPAATSARSSIGSNSACFTKARSTRSLGHRSKRRSRSRAGNQSRPSTAPLRCAMSNRSGSACAQRRSNTSSNTSASSERGLLTITPRSPARGART